MNQDDYRAMLDRMESDCRRMMRATTIFLVGTGLMIVASLLLIIGILANCLHGAYLWTVIVMFTVAGVVLMAGALRL